MATNQPHRKLVKHYHEPGDLHELTFSCYRRRPLLTNDPWRKLLAQAISRATKLHRYRLAAFVFMPEHVHLLVYPGEQAGTIDELLKAIKRPFSYQIKQLLTASNSKLLADLTIRQRPGVTTFRFWQEGPGYDRNLHDREAVLAAIDYFHNNPVKRKLCGRAIDWKWSSARQLLLEQFDADLPRIDPLPAEFLQ